MTSNPSDPQIVPEECALPLSPAKTPPPIPPIPPIPPTKYKSDFIMSHQI